MPHAKWKRTTLTVCVQVELSLDPTRTTRSQLIERIEREFTNCVHVMSGAFEIRGTTAKCTERDDD